MNLSGMGFSATILLGENGDEWQRGLGLSGPCAAMAKPGFSTLTPSGPKLSASWPEAVERTGLPGRTIPDSSASTVENLLPVQLAGGFVAIVAIRITLGVICRIFDSERVQSTS